MRAPLLLHLPEVTGILAALTWAVNSLGTGAADLATLTIAWVPGGGLTDAWQVKLYRASDLTSGSGKAFGPWVLIDTVNTPVSITSFLDTLDQYAGKGLGPVYYYKYKAELYNPLGALVQTRYTSSFWFGTSGKAVL